MNDFYVILTASLVAANCALMGSFLMMRKMVMIGDAISHAVLPGIVIAYLISGSAVGLPLLIGASVAGIFATILIEWFTKKVKLQNDASIGISYTLLFALGVILVSHFGQQVDLDQQCVLYGELEYVSLSLSQIGGITLPRQTFILGGLMVLLVIAVWVGYKGLVITTFDPSYAVSTGISVAFWHYFLMSGVSLTTVVSFESVGAILVIAFLAGPPAAAYLLSGKLKNMIILAVFFGIICSIGGYFMAKALNVSVAGAISSLIGLLFMLVFCASLIFKSKHDVIS